MDNGLIADSLLQAYKQLQSPNFPTLHFVNASVFNSSPSLIEQEVVNGHYWGAIYTNVNVSNQLTDAITNGGSAAAMYKPANAIVYIWDEVRYPVFADMVIGNSMTTLVTQSKAAFNKLYGAKMIQSLKQGDEAALQTLLNPIGASDHNLQPMLQGPRMLYNSISVAMMILQQFFMVLGPHIMALNLGLYKTMSWQRLAVMRFLFAIVSTFFCGLTVAGYYWAFRESWSVNANQFVLTWMVIWLVTLVYHLFLYAVSCFLPLLYMPLVLVTFIHINVTSTVSPFDINPGFYRWAYALPGYEAYSVMTDIWSGGRVRVLYRALPILFIWVVVTSLCCVYFHRRMCIKLAKVGPPSTTSPPTNAPPQDQVTPVTSSEIKSES
ncbi:hypothetical protein AWJ20_1351 [Sugiyamaella lignohabitans]|uniref:DUF3533 domain-containing protein n=1 Tax=Sugiyamaella lignohabitans TaxID=796027 RepID=A0A167DMH4_9ASCO|nr:uncharacterized protein AWJ20_1351 [Sugiyamaella lignohabitans]ANB13072.1 hypothetical protein AWJ20_1351 [Sugiyamaella lignohabitans]